MTTIFRIALCSILNYTDFSSRNMLNQSVKVHPWLASTVRKMSWEKTLKNTKDTIATRFRQHVNFKPWGATMIRYVISLLLCWTIAKVSIYLQWSVHFCFTFVTEEHWAVKDEKYKYIIFTPNAQMSKCNAINTHLVLNSLLLILIYHSSSIQFVDFEAKGGTPTFERRIDKSCLVTVTIHFDLRFPAEQRHHWGCQFTWKDCGFRTRRKRKELDYWTFAKCDSSRAWVNWWEYRQNCLFGVRKTGKSAAYATSYPQLQWHSTLEDWKLSEKTTRCN